MQVADCVCLMSLDKAGAIPVDTHVWQIANRDYMPKLKTTKSLTDKIYGEIGKTFIPCIYIYMYICLDLSNPLVNCNVLIQVYFVYTSMIGYWLKLVKTIV